MYKIIPTTQFKKDLKRAKKQGKDIAPLKKIIDALAAGEELPDKNRDHALTGPWQGYRECHILPDWLLIYKTDRNILVLTLTRTGSHSELF